MRIIIIAAFLLAANLATAQYTHPDRVGIVSQMSKYKLLKTGIEFIAAPLWWNPIHEIESPQAEWQVEYNFLLKWLDANGKTVSTTIKTWEPRCFWQGIKGTQYIYCTVKIVPHHKPGKHSALSYNDWNFGISLLNWQYLTDEPAEQ